MAGRIPDRFLDELLTRVDIVDVIGQRLQLKKAGSNYHGLCPFHTEKTPSFTVAPTKQFYHCFGCGAHGTAIRFLMEYDGMGFRDAVETLARQVGLEIPEEARGPAQDSHKGLYEVLSKAQQAYQHWLRKHPERRRAVDYLKGRGLSGEIAARFAIGFAPPGWDNILRRLKPESALAEAGLIIRKDNGRAYDRFRDRIMFPIRDRRGRTVGFGGRVLGDGEPKYLNSPDTPVFHKGRELYGLFECLQVERHPSELLVVEGYMDVVALAQFGFPRAVATLGTATTTAQVEALFQVTSDVVFCFDGDEAGRRAAWRALENALPAMRDGRQVRFLFLPEGEDPDSLVRSRGAEAFRETLGEARALSDFFFDHLREGVDIHTMDGRARLVDAAAPALRKLPSGIFRTLMVDRLAELARVDSDEIEAILTGKQEARRKHQEWLTEATGKPVVSRTPVRLAVALLLQRPSLAGMVTDTNWLRTAELPGVDLLIELVELIHAKPHISTSAILERFADDPHEAALWKLATWEHLVPESGLEEEFSGALGRIGQLLAEKRLQYLNDRLQQGELTPEEVREWQELKTRPQRPIH
ncbi:DNA primase [Ectothiorhodospiraceae bacterium WFHF3C12]|nr:DNA primase [Ectothiorhodospiraceae bacterium WFHF3C12]